MGVGAGLYMYDVVVKRLRLLSHLLMNSCQTNRQDHVQPCDLEHWSIWPCRSNVTESVWSRVIVSNIQVKARLLRKLSSTHRRIQATHCSARPLKRSAIIVYNRRCRTDAFECLIRRKCDLNLTTRQPCVNRVSTDKRRLTWVHFHRHHTTPPLLRAVENAGFGHGLIKRSSGPASAEELIATKN